MVKICRIWGVSYGDTPEKLSAGQIARVMFPALVGGGPHAYGWMQNVEGRIAVQKYFGRSDTQRCLNKTNGISRQCKWIVGHTRYATHGRPEDLFNDHPIKHGNILGVHNGVLHNHDDILSVTGREDPRSLVDSEAIFAAVNRWGLQKGLEKVRGNMVSVFTDLRTPDTLWIARSYGRYLKVGWTERGNLIFASEEQALLKLEEAGIKFTNVSGVSENRLLTVVKGDITSRITYREVIKPVYVPQVTIQGLRQLAGPPIRSSRRMEAARASLKAAELQGEHSWSRPHYNENGRIGLSTRETWEQHPRRHEIMAYLEDAYNLATDKAAMDIYKYLKKNGFLNRVMICTVMAKIDIPIRKAKKKGKKNRNLTTTEFNNVGTRLDADHFEYKGKLMRTDEYLTAICDDILGDK